MYETDAILITNRGICGQDVQEFYYRPKEEFECNISIFNESNEKNCLLRFLRLIQEYKPCIISSFNGDKFDWPYVDIRCQINGISL